MLMIPFTSKLHYLRFAAECDEIGMKSQSCQICELWPDVWLTASLNLIPQFRCFERVHTHYLLRKWMKLLFSAGHPNASAAFLLLITRSLHGFNSDKGDYWLCYVMLSTGLRNDNEI